MVEPSPLALLDLHREKVAQSDFVHHIVLIRTFAKLLE